MSTPVVIFVRHSADCKYQGDEFEKRCRCRKHLRWTQNGEQFRRAAGTRAWSEAEAVKRDLEDQLAGRVSVAAVPDKPKTVSEAVNLFLTDKKAQGVGTDVLYRYRHQLDRLIEFCDKG